MIYEMLHTGAENAIPRQVVMAATGLTDREVRRQVAKERMAGKPILTNVEGGGYYLPARVSEMEAFVASMRRRAKVTAQIARSVERTMMAELGQQELMGW